MIFHFVKRDFLDHRLLWFVLAVITLISIIGYFTGIGNYLWGILLYVYFFCALLPIGHIFGSQWRNQGQLSRYYLLSLPISHKELFKILQIRLLVYCLPCLILALLLPFAADLNSNEWPIENWVLYYLGVLGSIMFFINIMIYWTLEMERLIRYVPKKERLVSGIKSVVVFFGCMFILTFAWQGVLIRPSYFLKYLPYIVFPGIYVVLLFLIPYNAKKWCVTL